MSRLCNFIYCLNAVHTPEENGNGERIDAMGVLSTLIPEFVPGSFSFSVIFSVMDIDTSASNTIQVSFFKEGESKPLVQTDIISLPPLPNQNDEGIPAEYQGLNMSLDFRNVIFEQKGIYQTAVYFNGELLDCVPIYVKGKRDIK